MSVRPAVVDLIFPPSLLAGALVGAGIGLGVGGLAQAGDRGEIKADVDDALPRGSFGIVALIDGTLAADLDTVLTRATKVATYKVDRANASAVTEGVIEAATPRPGE